MRPTYAPKGTGSKCNRIPSVSIAVHIRAMSARLPTLCLLIAALAVLVGCRRYQTVEGYGVFSLTRHMLEDLVDWEGGASSQSSVTFCSKVDRTCVDADNGTVTEPLDKTRIHDRIAVFLHDGSGDDAKTTLSFHDTNSGATLRCLDCDADTDIEARIVGRHSDRDLRGSFKWGATGAIGVATFAEGYDRIRLMLLEFEEAGYRATRMADVPASQFDISSLAIAPDDAGVGWYACDPLCTLYEFDRERRTLLATDVPCKYNTYLDIGWLDRRAFARHYWGTNQHNLCLDADGHPALSRGKGPTWTPSRDDDPKPPASVSELPPAYVP